MRQPPAMRLCPACSCHFRDGASGCPHCGAGPARPWGGLSHAAAATLFAASLVSLAGCGGRDKYGTPMAVVYGPAPDSVDADADGWVGTSDCDDSDPNIHPQARETPRDGIDSNCNGKDSR